MSTFLNHSNFLEFKFLFAAETSYFVSVLKIQHHWNQLWILYYVVFWSRAYYLRNFFYFHLVVTFFKLFLYYICGCFLESKNYLILFVLPINHWNSAYHELFYSFIEGFKTLFHSFSYFPSLSNTIHLSLFIWYLYFIFGL